MVSNRTRIGSITAWRIIRSFLPESQGLVRPCGLAKDVASKICLRRYNQRLLLSRP